MTIEELVVDGLNSVYEDMMDVCVDNNIPFADFVEQVAKAAREYAVDCNVTPDDM